MAGRPAMSLPGEIRTLADRILARLDQDREFYVHSRQAWRLVEKLARKGHPVGIVDLGSKQQLPTGELESRSQAYVITLAESVFKGLSSLLEDWVLGLIRIWLRAYPEDLDLHSTSTRPRASAGAGSKRRSRSPCLACCTCATAPRSWTP
jgi:hypothetical protein